MSLFNEKFTTLLGSAPLKKVSKFVLENLFVFILAILFGQMVRIFLFYSKIRKKKKKKNLILIKIFKKK